MGEKTNWYLGRSGDSVSLADVEDRDHLKGEGIEIDDGDASITIWGPKVESVYTRAEPKKEKLKSRFGRKDRFRYVLKETETPRVTLTIDQLLEAAFIVLLKHTNLIEPEVRETFLNKIQHYSPSNPNGTPPGGMTREAEADVSGQND